jgi:predicted dehydrogenase
MQKVAVIGGGTMGRTHAGAYAKMPNAELVAICDIAPEAAEALAGKHSVPAFSSLDKALAEVEIDVVDVCTPTSTHLEWIKAAAAKGKNICSEKPLGRTTGQAMEAVRVCEEAGVTLFIAHVVRWFPEFRKLHDLIAAGTVGDVAIVRTSRAGTFPGGWFADAKMSGGVVLDLTIHDFDWLQWCFGKVRRVYARGLYESHVNGADYALVTLRFECGVIAHVESCWARPSGFETSVEVAGSKGLLSFSSKDSTPLTVELKAKVGAETGVIVPESPTSVDPYYLELEHFITCLEEGRTPDVTPQDGLNAVRVGEAALRSITTGQPVALA